MIKQEQTEEMANCNKCVHKKICKNEFKDAPIIKFQGCEHYQPELPKDSVVLSREEQEKILTATEKRIKELKKQILQARKETAEKILTELLDFVNGWFEGVENNDFGIEFNRISKDLAEKYGVKIKE